MGQLDIDITSGAVPQRLRSAAQPLALLFKNIRCIDYQNGVQLFVKTVGSSPLNVRKIYGKNDPCDHFIPSCQSSKRITRAVY
jgi:hypothetical protein